MAVLAWRLPVDPAGRKESVAEDAAPPRGTAASTASGSPPQVPSSVEAVPSASAAPSTTPPPVTDTLCVIDASGGAGSRPRILRAEELCGYLQSPGEPALSCSEQQLDYGRLRARFVEGIPTHFISNGHPRVLDVLRARVSGSTLWSYVKLAEQSQIRKWSHSVEVKNLCSDRAALVIGSEFKVASLGLRP